HRKNSRLPHPALRCRTQKHRPPTRRHAPSAPAERSGIRTHERSRRNGPHRLQLYRPAKSRTSPPEPHRPLHLAPPRCQSRCQNALRQNAPRRHQPRLSAAYRHCPPHLILSPRASDPSTTDSLAVCGKTPSGLGTESPAPWDAQKQKQRQGRRTRVSALHWRRLWNPTPSQRARRNGAPFFLLVSALRSRRLWNPTPSQRARRNGAPLFLLVSALHSRRLWNPTPSQRARRNGAPFFLLVPVPL